MTYLARIPRNEVADLQQEFAQKLEAKSKLDRSE
jgi:hypothetical protein